MSGAVDLYHNLDYERGNRQRLVYKVSSLEVIKVKYRLEDSQGANWFANRIFDSKLEVKACLLYSLACSNELENPDKLEIQKFTTEELCEYLGFDLQIA